MRCLLTAAVLLGVVSGPAWAQGSATPAVPERFYLSVNGARQMLGDDFSQTFTFPANAEEARVESDYSIGAAPSFDVAGGVALSPNVGIGAGFTRSSRAHAAIVTASIPHPFFFDRPRVIDGSLAAIEHEHRAIHVQLRLFAPVGRLQVAAFGGPSFHRLKQGLVETVSYSESYPFDDATFGRATAEVSEKSQLGFNVGVDLAYYFQRHLGAGVTAMYDRTKVEMPAASGPDVTVHAGGLHLGGGLRLRF